MNYNAPSDNVSDLKEREIPLRASRPEPMNILLVEDDASDVMLAEIALEAARLEYDLFTLADGAEVMPYISKHGKYRDEPRPDMVMLDLSLPRMDGFEVLAQLASQRRRFGDLPIIILTGDTHSAFLKSSYGLNIAAYLTKPCSAKKMREAVAAARRGRR